MQAKAQRHTGSQQAPDHAQPESSLAALTAMPADQHQHVTVLLQEGIDALNPTGTNGQDAARLNGVYVDGTFGRGGHTRALLAALGPQARVFAFDRDPQAILEASKIQDDRFQIFHAAFADIASQLATMGVMQIDGLLLDVGVSSPQLDDAQRGFSFRFDGPLDMRMDNSSGMSAADYVNNASVDELRKVIADYGEERFALSIAKAIVARRAVQRFRTTSELANLVAETVRTREKGQHPATRTFQALRIHVNQELTQLALALEAALPLLKPQGRLAVISFHSLEDRIVKQFINKHATLDEATARLPLKQSELPLPVLQKIARVYASPEQIDANPRARSAVMRVAQRTEAPLRDEQQTRLNFDGAQGTGSAGQKWQKRRAQ